MSLIHEPVLVKEVVRILDPVSKKVYLDCTIGGGGHASHILEVSKPHGFLVGLDADENTIGISRKNLKMFEGRFKLINERFEKLDLVLDSLHIEKVDGILMDLGMSSIQLDDPARGFSFKKNGGLDMRFSRSQRLKASDIINHYSRSELERIIREYGEEKWSKKIANNIVKQRSRARIETTLELSGIIKNSIPRKFWSKRIDVSTKTFQAIRIAVNQELESLGETIRTACDRLNSNGRIVIIAYHSLEDRIVKNTFKELSSDCICPPRIPVCVCNHKSKGKILSFEKIEDIKNKGKRTSSLSGHHSKNAKSGTKGIRRTKHKYLLPDEDEIRKNPRARSAKLRAFERILDEEN